MLHVAIGKNQHPSLRSFSVCFAKTIIFFSLFVHNYPILEMVYLFSKPGLNRIPYIYINKRNRLSHAKENTFYSSIDQRIGSIILDAIGFPFPMFAYDNPGFLPAFKKLERPELCR